MARDDTANVHLQVRLREDLRRSLEQAAKARHVSLNQEIVDRLDYVRDRLGLLHEIFELAYGERVAGILMMLGRVMRVAGDKGKEGDWTPEDFDDAAKAGSVLLQALRSGATVPASAADVPEMLALNMLRGLADPNYRDRFAPDTELDKIRSLLAPIVARWGGEHRDNTAVETVKVRKGRPSETRSGETGPDEETPAGQDTRDHRPTGKTLAQRGPAAVRAAIRASMEADPWFQERRARSREMSKIIKSTPPSLTEGKGKDAPPRPRNRRRDN